MAAGPLRPVTALEMAVLEQNAVALGVSLDELMENAGRAVAEEAARHLPPAPARVAILTGPGNNGGDGSCTAFYLGQWGYSPELFLPRPPSDIRSAAARRCFERAQRRYPVHVEPPSAEQLGDFALIVDALLGSGQMGELREEFARLTTAANQSGRPILAVDVPTGSGTAQSTRPRWTVALTSPKAGTDSESAGELVVRAIGIPEEARVRAGPGEFLFFPTLASRGARGRSGRVLIIGGGPYSGAPALAGLAALRSGAERATILAPRPAAYLIQPMSPNLVVNWLGENILRPNDLAKIRETVERGGVKAVVLGMGLGSDPETLRAAGTLVEELSSRVPLVVDADALGSVAAGTSRRPPLDPARAVFTPNSGEYVRYFGGRDAGSIPERLEEARTRAAALGVTLLVKGEPDLLTDGVQSRYNAHHHSAMTVSGVGDVLAGVVGSLMAQGVAAFPAARLATYWVGEAGIRATSSRGYGLIATDLVEELSLALVDGVRRVRGDEPPAAADQA